MIEIYTLGHGNRSLEELVELLNSSAIKLLIDVRSWPKSKRNPRFDRTSLEASLLGIDYLWEGKDLGGFRKSKGGSPHSEIRSDGFRAYADHMGTEEFRSAVERVLKLAEKAATALMCAEQAPDNCHRNYLCDYLVFSGAKVVHLLSGGKARDHSINPSARIDGERLVYDQPTGQLEFGF